MPNFKFINKIAATISTNYWATPAIFVVSAFVLFGITFSIDQNYSLDKLIPVLNYSSPDSIKVFLSIIAGSIMTVTGVSFSMTLLAVAHASSQIGPRILSGFLDDRGNQITLGVLVGCFIYSLLTLSVVHSGQSGSAYVPKISLIISVIWMIAAIFSFIYFIHHVPTMIRTTYAIALVGKKSVKEINSYFTNKHFRPDKIPHNFIDTSLYVHSAQLSCRESGYIKYINFDSLLKSLCKNDLLLKMQNETGEHIVCGQVIAKLYSKEQISVELVDEVMNSVVIGPEKSMQQDYKFGIYLLVEIGARALSPGINDPFTFKECLDQLRTIFTELDKVSHKACTLYDDRDIERMYLKAFDYEFLQKDILKSLEYYVEDDPQGRPYFLKFMASLKGINQEVPLVSFDNNERMNTVL